MDFVETWSKDDPAAAANYFMAHPEKFPVSDINFPVMEALARDLTSGIEWIQTFPDGPHFDAAATVAVERLRIKGNLDEARQLAAQIGNPESRKKIMEAAMNPPVHHREKD